MPYDRYFASISIVLIFLSTFLCKIFTWSFGVKSVFTTTIHLQCLQTYFGPRVYQRGSYVITHVCSSVVRWSVRGSSLNIADTALRIFLIFCMKLVHHKGTKVTESDFCKEILVGHKWGKNPIFRAFLMFFVHISKTALTILM